MTTARVLIVAENASTRLGGEAILPWHYFRLLRERGVDAHLIVHARMRDELLETFAADRDRLHFIEDHGLQKLFYRMGRVLPRRLDEATLGLANQMITQLGQRAVVRRLRVPGMVVHQPIPVSPRFPSLLAVDDVPLVVGPLNGGMEYPRAFRGAESLLSRAAIALGRTFSDVTNRLLAGKRKAAVVLVANQRTREALPGGLRGRVVELPENGVDTAQWRASAGVDEPGAARFVFVGRLVEWKALDVAIEALREVPEAILDVIGEGEMRGAWERLAQDLGVAERVRFLGWRTQSECAVHLLAAAALVLPSIYECGGAVVLEAMAMSRPVIATDWGGPADYLDASCGILIEPVSREALVEGFAAGMRRLLASAELRVRMGMAGRERLLREFDWARKIDAMLAIYGVALEDAAARGQAISRDV